MSTKVASSAPKAIRRLQIQKESDLPKDACQTPGRLFSSMLEVYAQSLGGTMFGTTPGGSKIVYDRLYLLKVRDSPASHVSYIQRNIFRITFGTKTGSPLNYPHPRLSPRVRAHVHFCETLILTKSLNSFFRPHRLNCHLYQV